MNTIGIDWGSSSLRAYLFDTNHNLLDKVESDRGITRLPRSSENPSGKEHSLSKKEHFESTLYDVVADWRQSGMRVLLSGMVTSRNGWVETPYMPCPANPRSLFDFSVSMEWQNLKLSFLPGVCQVGTQQGAEVMPDVMRGEELQLLAIGPKTGTELIVLPGTHSKWAVVDSDAILAFRTIPTGELFDVLLSHSLVGGLAQSHEQVAWSDSHFNDGVEFSFTHDMILGQLFTCRSSVLLEQRTPSESHSWLSGLLIGREIREGVSLQQSDVASIRLVGNAKLCKLYEQALQHLGIGCETDSRDAAQYGYQRMLSSIC